MLGLNLDLKETIYGALAGAKEEALGKIPGYNAVASEFRRFQARQKLKGPKSDTNTVDEYEYKKAVRNIDAEIGGSLNPIKWIWGAIQSIFGNSKQERMVAAIKSLENYGNQYDAYRFVNDAQEFLFTKIEKRISEIEGLSSKILGTSKAKVSNDPILQALKSAIQIWLEPFSKIINGEVAEIAKPSEGDIRLLKSIRDRIQYSSKARYIEDMLPKYNQMISEAQRALYSNHHAGQQQPRAHHRKLGQNLAKTAA